MTAAWTDVDHGCRFARDTVRWRRGLGDSSLRPRRHGEIFAKALPSFPPKGAWLRDLTEDGDVEPHPGPRNPALPVHDRIGINLLSNRGLEPLEIQRRARALDLFAVCLRFGLSLHDLETLHLLQDMEW